MKLSHFNCISLLSAVECIYYSATDPINHTFCRKKYVETYKLRPHRYKLYESSSILISSQSTFSGVVNFILIKIGIDPTENGPCTSSNSVRMYLECICRTNRIDVMCNSVCERIDKRKQNCPERSQWPFLILPR